MSKIKVDTIQSTQHATSTIGLTSTGATINGDCNATTFTGSGANLTALPAANLTGTVPDAAFPATLPTVSGANLTNLPVDLTQLDAANLTSGTIPNDRFPATLPTASGTNLTSLPSANLTGALPALDGSALTGIGGGGSYEFISKTTISSSTSYVDYTLDQDNIYKIWCTRMTRTGANNSYPMIQLFTNGSSSLDTSSQHTTEYHNARSGGGYRSGVNDMEIDAGQYGNTMYYELDVSTYLYGWLKIHGSLLRTAGNTGNTWTDTRFDSYCQHDDYANKYISGLRLYLRFGNMDVGTQFLVYKLKQS